MKSNIKKIITLLLVAIMIFSMNITAFATGVDAQGDKYVITINNPIGGHTYTAYQIFTGDLAENPEDPDKDILTNIEWSDTLSTSDDLLALLKANETFGSKFTDCKLASDVATAISTLTNDELKAFATAVGDWLKDHATKYGDASVFDSDAGTYTFSDVEAGYYLITDVTPDDDAASRYLLQVVGNTSITPKAGVPTVVKKVLEDSNIGDKMDIEPDQGNYNDVADWEIGQTKSFKLYAKLPTAMWDYDTYKLIFTDTFVKGLTVTDENGTPLDEGDINLDNFTVKYIVDGVETLLNPHPFTGTLTNPVGDDKGELIFSCNDIKASLEKAGVTRGEVTITIEYNAKLNKDAVVGFGGNINDVYLEFSNDPNDVDGLGKTEVDKVIVFTFTLEGTKVDADNTESKIDGAEFKLGNEDGTKWAVIENGILTGWTTEGEATTITTTNGVFEIKGVDSGSYVLRETKAPNGYNKLEGDLNITITSKLGENGIYTQEVTIDKAIDDLLTNIGGESANQTDYGKVKFTIENKKGSTLPETGDTGSFFFYAFGAIGSLVCIVILITKKRMSKYNSK